jgi:hypothetical protein
MNIKPTINSFRSSTKTKAVEVSKVTRELSKRVVISAVNAAIANTTSEK